MKIITCVTNSNQPGYVNGLKASCEFFKLNLTVLTSKEWQTHRNKDLLLFDYLKKIDPNEIILFTDGYDTIFLAGEQEIMQKYNKVAKLDQVVISADRVCSPDHEQSVYFKKTKHGYNYLNTGGIIGPAGEIMKILLALKKLHTDDQNIKNKHYNWSNQYTWSQIYNSKNYDILLDSNCEIFQTLTSKVTLDQLFDYRNSEKELEYEENIESRPSIQKTIQEVSKEIEIQKDFKIFNRTTKTFPIHLHFNSEILKFIMFLDPFVKIIDRYNP